MLPVILNARSSIFDTGKSFRRRCESLTLDESCSRDLTSGSDYDQAHLGFEFQLDGTRTSALPAAWGSLRGMQERSPSSRCSRDGAGTSTSVHHQAQRPRNLDCTEAVQICIPSKAGKAGKSTSEAVADLAARKVLHTDRSQRPQTQRL